MSNAYDEDENLFLVDFIDHTIVADADAIGLLFALEFLAAARMGIFKEPINYLANAHYGGARQFGSSFSADRAYWSL